MKHPALYLLLLPALSCNPVRNADRLAEKNKMTVMYPEQAFDKAAAKNQLATGKATLRGVLYQSTNKLSVVGAKAYGTGVKVALLPVTDYLYKVGYDWFYFPIAGTECLVHDGGTEDFRSFLYQPRTKNTALVVPFNNGTDAAASVANELAEKLLP